MYNSDELAKRIRARIGELEAEIEAHERALAALEGRSDRNRSAADGARLRTARRAQRPMLELIPTPDPAPTRAGTTPRRRGRRPVVSADAVFVALREGNDEAAQIAKEFGVSTAVVGQRLKQLEQAGRVSRSGQRRGTRWHTDGGQGNDPAA